MKCIKWCSSIAAMVCLFVLAITTSLVAGRITADGNDVLYTDKTGITCAYSEPGEKFGYAMVIGDFNGDKRGDIAIGAPKHGRIRCSDGPKNTGGVTIFYGSESGYLGVARGESQILYGTQGGEGFGHALATGDFNGDNISDLAVGSPYYDKIANEFPGYNDRYHKTSMGKVTIYYGSIDNGLGPTFQRSCYGSIVFGLYQDHIGTSEAYDQFGFSLAVGDFNKDGLDDLVVGVPYEDLGNLKDAGVIHVIHGSECHGLDLSSSSLWHQNSEEIEGTAEAGDRFGWSLAVGDFDYNRYDDLAVGAPYEDVRLIRDAGVVNVIYGRQGGLNSRNDQHWHQDIDGIQYGCEVGDRFGYSLAAGTFDGGWASDLAIGVPYEDVGNIPDAGIVQIIYGERNIGLTKRDQVLHQSCWEIWGKAEKNDRFGWSLASGQFNNYAGMELAIGVPFEDLGDIIDAGVVHVMQGNSRGEGIDGTGRQLWHQDIEGVHEKAEARDKFGWSLASGNLNLIMGRFGRVWYHSLAIGVVRESVFQSSGSDAKAEGLVHILYYDDTVY